MAHLLGHTLPPRDEPGLSLTPRKSRLDGPCGRAPVPPAVLCPGEEGAGGRNLLWARWKPLDRGAECLSHSLTVLRKETHSGLSLRIWGGMR